jgi:hypothetical protein
MVKGLQIFREHFRDYADRYVLIGGAACDIAMTGDGSHLGPQRTWTSFSTSRLWMPRLSGRSGNSCAPAATKYRRSQRARSSSTASRSPLTRTILLCWNCSHGSPMCRKFPKAVTSHHYRLKSGISSLSAILLDNNYYAFIRAGSIEVDGLPTVGAPRLIALKARAWLDLTERERRGEKIDSKTIKKHKNDVFWLFRFSIQPTTPQPRRPSRGIFANSLPECATKMLT